MKSRRVLQIRMSTKHRKQSHTTDSVVSSGARNSACAPEFFPLPQRGFDPHFGLGRTTFYDLEKRGLLRLVRVRKPGNIRGKVLVPYAATAALIRRMGKAGAASTPSRAAS